MSKFQTEQATLALASARTRKHIVLRLKTPIHFKQTYYNACLTASKPEKTADQFLTFYSY